MARQPLPLGSWGRIRLDPGRNVRKGRPTSWRARTQYRDFDGVTRPVEAGARTKTEAEAKLLRLLQDRASIRHCGALRPADKFSVAAELWMSRITDLVADGRRSPGTLDTYRRHLDNHVLPALGEVRLGEITTPLVDQVIRTIKIKVSPATAKSCRSVISGVVGLAVRLGAMRTNPVRDAEPLSVKPRRRPRALDKEERDAWFATLAADPRAVKADLPDLTLFMLSTGVRIGEALGLLWSEVDLNLGQVEIAQQVIRVKGRGLVRAATKSSAGERVLHLPESCLAMLAARAAPGIRGSEPVFCDALGGHRDPSNVRRDLRNARSPVGSQARVDLGKQLAAARSSAGLTQREAAAQLNWPRTRVGLAEHGRIRLPRADVLTVLDAYAVPTRQRQPILDLAEVAAEPVEGDALSWITSHNFRKTTATILDDAGQSARAIADQLGHARPSMTQDVYMSCGTKNPGAAAAIEQAMGNKEEPKNRG